MPNTPLRGWGSTLLDRQIAATECEIIQMNQKNEIKESELKAAIAAKLTPARFPNVSGKMFGCLGALLNQKWTQPRLACIVATGDGMLLGRDEGDIGFNQVLGDFSDFKRNALGMADDAGDLTEEERAFLDELLQRVENGEESTTGTTSSNLAIESISRSSN